MQKLRLSDYEAIFFDLGGVFISLDFQRAIHNFSNLSGKDFSVHFAHKQQHPIFDTFEKGLISPSEFREKIKNELLQNASISDEDIDTAWNSLLVDFPVHKLNFLHRISQKIPSYLISNNNAIHVEGCHELCRKSGGPKKIHHLFSKVYLSHEIGLRKPEKEIFEMALHENKLSADKVIFIDDSIQHIEGAMRVGLHTFHLTSDIDIVDIFRT